MNDPEETAERDIRLAVYAARKSDASIWVTGFWAARVVGKYQRYGTKAIAERSGKSPSTVENWAHAWNLYDDLREKYGTSPNIEVGRIFIRSLQNLRKSLSPSHFWTAWELKKKYDLADKVILRHLQLMLDYKTDGQPYSVDILRQEVEKETKGGGASWEWWMPRVASMIESVLLVTDLPDEWKDWLSTAPLGDKPTTNS